MRHSYRKWLGSLVLLLLGATAAAAQNRVQGNVVSAETLEPLSGVLVSVQGASISTVTNAEGRYSISVPAGATLTFQRLGFATQTIAVQGRTVIDVQLEVSAIALDEIVAVGYTQQTRRSIAGAVSSVGSEDLEIRVATSVEEAMKGRVAGVNIRGSGEPGEAPRVTIRGNAFTADNDPLYVVDGMYLNDIRNINPNDVESIQVLKDASAASQYGARAANGVIVITTKQGRAADNNQVTLRSSYGIQQIPRLIPMMNSREWAELYQEKYENSRAIDPTSPTVPAGALEVLNGTNTYDTDWQDAITRTGALQDHTLSVSGGTLNGNATYFVSGGYSQQTGTLIETDYRRYSMRVNSTLRRGRFTVGENVMLSRSVQLGEAGPGGPLGNAVNSFPSIPLYNDGNFGPPEAIYGIGTANYPSFADNAVGALKLYDQTNERNQLVGSLFGHADLIPGLQYRLQLGLRYNNNNSESFTETAMIRQNTGPFPANMSVNTNNQTQILVEHLLSLNRTFGIHAINATAGYTQERLTGDAVNASRTTFDNEELRVLSAGQLEINNSQTKVESRLNSYLARVGYTLSDRYILEASYRRDGSSRFGPQNRWGEFYAGAAGWIVSDEEFFESLPLVGGIPYLKLRGSYGTQGNQDFADYEWQATVISNEGGFGEARTCCSYLFGSGEGNITSGLMTISLNNPALRWQDNTMANVGFDMGLLDNRLSISGEYYMSESDGVLARVPLIPSIGSRTDPFVNAASLRNSGFEFTLQHTTTRGDLNLSTGLNLTTLKNEVLALGGQDEDIITGASRTAVGRPLGSFYVLETCGIFDTQAEIDAHGVQPDARPGDLCFVDHNGDGMITQNDDRHYAGDPYPDFDVGLFIDGQWRALDFRLGVRGAFGQKAYNGIRPGIENTNGDSNAPAWLRPWQGPDDDDANAPKPYWGGLGADNARGPNDRFLEDNSFVRLQNVQLGYAVPSGFLNTLGLSMDRARIYVNLQDIYTFTDYLGFDPEFRGGTLSPGEDGGGTYPNPRTIGFGIDIGF